ncbi:MAG: hypothetical protein OEZ06_05945 [Myxococcales bacterium]|nr:hypothetical protein [Myxococcales bacterium]
MREAGCGEDKGPWSQSAIAFCRALLSLGRSRCSGIVRVDCERGRSGLVLNDGRIVGLHGPFRAARALGDALIEAGQLDAAAHLEALRADHESDASPDAKLPAGRWLLRHGLASAQSIDRALRLQVEEQLRALLSCEQLRSGFQHVPAQGPGIDDASWPTIADVVFDALTAQVSDSDRRDIAQRLRGRRVRLTKRGESTLGALESDGSNAELMRVLQGGVCFDVAITSAGVERLFVAAERLGFLRDADAAVSGERYRLLLRKRRQLRAGSDAHSLLELDADANAGAARRALRRLARDLHPDGFDADAPPGLRRVAEEVMGDLVAAERHLQEHLRSA